MRPWPLTVDRTLRLPVGVALASLACLLLVALYPVQPQVPPRPAGAFEVQVIRPRITRALFGILPAGLEARLSGEPVAPGFSQVSEGAGTGTVLPDQVAFHARDWDLHLQVDAAGHLAPGTVLEFPLVLGGRPRRLRCIPGPGGSGTLRTWTEEGLLSGAFDVRLSQASDAVTGKPLKWPPAPLRVVGQFHRLPMNPGPEPVSGR